MRCRRRRAAARPRTPPAGSGRGRRPASRARAARLADEQAQRPRRRFATCRWRLLRSWSEIIGVIGCRSIRALSPRITDAHVVRPRPRRPGAGSSWNRRSGAQSFSSTGRAATPGRRGSGSGRARPKTSALTSTAPPSGVPDEVHSVQFTDGLRAGRRGRIHRPDRGDPVHGETAEVLAPVDVRRELAALDPDRGHDPLGLEPWLSP